MKKLLAIILSVWMILSFATCSSDGGDAPEPDTEQLSSSEPDVSEIDLSNLPSKVDLRNFDGKNYVTPVKAQKFGDCWSFSLAGSAEIAYLYANDLGVPAGEVNDRVNFSEKYIAWYLFHGITGDDVVKGKVRASQVGEGFDVSKAEKTDKKAVYSIGGEFIHFANMFGSGFGPVDESVTVNGEQPYAYIGETWTLPLNAEYRNPPVGAFIRESRVLPSPAGKDSDGNYSFSEEGINAIKAELYQGHGVSLGCCTSRATFNMKNRAAYYNGDDPADHAVVVVGYDDDYPKENFTVDGEDNSTPPENGALIIKNSWGVVGDDEDDIDDGYIYLSYFDHSLTSAMSYVFYNNKSVKHTAPNYDQYDLMMTDWYACEDHDSETKMANVFDAEEDESLYRIAYQTVVPNAEVTYEIYKDIKDDDPSSGTLLEQGTNSHEFAGFFMIDLKDEYQLKKGEKYAVVLTMKHTDDDSGKSVYTELYPYSIEFSYNMTVRGIVNEGESYLYTDGKWSDMADLIDSLIERAYRQCADEFDSKDTFTYISLESKETFTVDNYPIKALLAPAG